MRILSAFDSRAELSAALPAIIMTIATQPAA